MFERFTEEARRVVVLAKEEALALGQDEIAPDHLLLGLLRVDDGIAFGVLESFGLDADGVRSQLPAGAARSQGQVPFAANTKKALELSLREALSLGQNYIGTEHLLLGLARANEGGGSAAALPPSDVVRNAVIERLGPPAQPGGRFARSFYARRAPLQWEYRVEQRDAIDAEWLNGLGADGWELAAITDSTLVFKRRRQYPGSLRAAG